MTVAASEWLRTRVVPRVAKAAYMPILAIAMVAMFLRVLVTAKLLSVDQFAVFNTVLVASNLISIAACFGLFPELQRLLPVQLEFKRLKSASRQVSLAIIGCFSVSIFAFLTIFLLSIFYEINLTLWSIGIIHCFSLQLFLISTTESRSSGDTFRFSIQNIFRSLLVLSSTIIIAATTNSATLVLLSEIIVTLVVSTLLIGRAFARFGMSFFEALRLALRKMRVLDWNSMVFLVLISATAMAATNADRWIAVSNLEKLAFAQYSFASIILTAGASVQALINASIYPAIAKRLARYGYKVAFRLVLITSVLCLLICSVLIVPGVFVSHALVLRFYPDYLDAIPLIPILAIVAMLRLSDFWASLLVISGSERAGVIINALSLAGPFAIWYLLMHNSETTLRSVAFFTLAVSISTYLFSAIQCWRDAHRFSPR
jgi:O-antigen/teichoic acid export membrane protein